MGDLHVFHTYAFQAKWPKIIMRFSRGCKKGVVISRIHHPPPFFMRLCRGLNKGGRVEFGVYEYGMEMLVDAGFFLFESALFFFKEEVYIRLAYLTAGLKEMWFK